MANKIRCSQCRFVRTDTKASEKGWRAVECGNTESEHYKALLNVSPGGDKQTRITWSGCEKGEPR